MNKPDYLISTPENVDLHLELAGLGNRVLAGMIDTIITNVLIGTVVLICVGVGFALDRMGLNEDFKNAAYFYLIGAGIIIAFLINFGYYIYFEGIWKGQTPGKKFAHIRVIEANGQPINWPSVWIRNLIRIIDLGLGCIGVAVILIDKNERRIGDFAAGTLVIRERLPGLSTRAIKTSATLPKEAFVDAGQLLPDEYQMLVTYLRRRERMPQMERNAMAKQLNEYYRARLNFAESEPEPPEATLEKLYLAYTAQHEVSI